MYPLSKDRGLAVLLFKGYCEPGKTIFPDFDFVPLLLRAGVIYPYIIAVGESEILNGFQRGRQLNGLEIAAVVKGISRNGFKALRDADTAEIPAAHKCSAFNGFQR